MANFFAICILKLLVIVKVIINRKLSLSDFLSVKTMGIIFICSTLEDKTFYDSNV